MWEEPVCIYFANKLAETEEKLQEEMTGSIREEGCPSEALMENRTHGVRMKR